MDAQAESSWKYDGKLFLLKDEYGRIKFENINTAAYSIAELTIDLSVSFKKTNGRFIDELTDFYLRIKELARRERIKLKGFKSDKKAGTIIFKANGTPKNLNDLLTALKAETDKFAMRTLL